MKELIYINTPAFIEHGACATEDPELFFPDRGENAHYAKEVCRSCDVQTACLDWAMTTNEKHGIWGGLSESERLRLRRTGLPQRPAPGGACTLDGCDIPMPPGASPLRRYCSEEHAYIARRRRKEERETAA